MSKRESSAKINRERRKREQRLAKKRRKPVSGTGRMVKL
jgi:hypothetical protein